MPTARARKRARVPGPLSYRDGGNCLEHGDALANSDLFLERARGGAAYRLWIDASDIYDAPRHDVSVAAVNRQLDDHASAFAKDWLSIDVNDDEVSDYFGRWVG